MTGVDPQAMKFALKKIKDGFTFESFAQEFLSQKLGYEFVPAGGIKDRGIDGLEHIFHRAGFERTIYQTSIEKSCDTKLQGTLEKLRKNEIKYESLTYVTQQVFQEKDLVVDRLYDEYQKSIRIFDLDWFAANVNANEGTVRAYQAFTAKHLHEYARPGKSFEINNLDGDPRLFVFLRQQFEQNHQSQGLDEILADTLILYSLEGTDPDQAILKTEADIKQEINNYIKFEPRKLHPTIEKRLKAMSRKPRRIKYHAKEKGYVLPYETRLEIQERNFRDVALHEAFLQTSEDALRKHLKDAQVEVRDGVALLESVFGQIFRQQGLEFADFVLRGENQSAIEKDLRPLIANVVDESKVVTKNREAVKTALHLTVRDIVYNGTKEQKEFLQRLSNTYMMLFLLQCDPKLSTYFYAMAGQLRVYVCNSIIVPAMSEFYLDDVNRRHWNLLIRARRAGVELVINDTIVDELVSHLKKSLQKYKDEFEPYEGLYAEESQILYIEPILIRAYFYAKLSNPKMMFREYLDNFISPNFSRPKEDLIIWLKETFGIKYQSDSSLGVTISASEKEDLEEELAETKKDAVRARNDAALILTIYALREKNSENESSGIFGYRTWWLSKDVLTHSAVSRVFKNKYKTSCYIRPDFLYNYVSLAPSPQEVEDAFAGIFPTLLGINLSLNLPEGVVDTVQRFISEHHSRSANNPGRVKAILRELSDSLKTKPSIWTRLKVRHYLDEKAKEYQLG